MVEEEADHTADSGEMAQRPQFPLHEAAQAADAAKIKQLIESGQDVKERSSFNGMRLLAIHHACFARGLDQDKQVETVQALLLAWPESIDMGDQDMGITPLNFAASNGNPKVCELLLGAGANIAIANCMGGTPIQGARDYKRDNPENSEAADEVIKILEAASK